MFINHHQSRQVSKFLLSLKYGNEKISNEEVDNLANTFKKPKDLVSFIGDCYNHRFFETKNELQVLESIIGKDLYKRTLEEYVLRKLENEQ